MIALGKDAVRRVFPAGDARTALLQPFVSLLTRSFLRYQPFLIYPSTGQSRHGLCSLGKCNKQACTCCTGVWQSNAPISNSTTQRESPQWKGGGEMQGTNGYSKQARRGKAHASGWLLQAGWLPQQDGSSARAKGSDNLT